jgi:hypothetical protein
LYYHQSFHRFWHDFIKVLDHADQNLYRYYIYFTRLTFIGVTAYFSAVAFQTGFFVLSLRQLKRGKVSRAPWYPLQKWPKVFQFLHLWLFSTIITMRTYFFVSYCSRMESSNVCTISAVVVTAVYWAFLADASSFADPFTSELIVAMNLGCLRIDMRS